MKVLPKCFRPTEPVHSILCTWRALSDLHSAALSSISALHAGGWTDAHVRACVLAHAADIWVAVAGPLMHVPMAAAWLLALLLVHHANTGSWDIDVLDLEDSIGNRWFHTDNSFWQAVCASAFDVSISRSAAGRLLAKGNGTQAACVRMGC